MPLTTLPAETCKHTGHLCRPDVHGYCFWQYNFDSWWVRVCFAAKHLWDVQNAFSAAWASVAGMQDHQQRPYWIWTDSHAFVGITLGLCKSKTDSDVQSYRKVLKTVTSTLLKGKNAIVLPGQSSWASMACGFHFLPPLTARQIASFALNAKASGEHSFDAESGHILHATNNLLSMNQIWGSVLHIDVVFWCP